MHTNIWRSMPTVFFSTRPSHLVLLKICNVNNCVSTIQLINVYKLYKARIFPLCNIPLSQRNSREIKNPPKSPNALVRWIKRKRVVIFSFIYSPVTIRSRQLQVDPVIRGFVAIVAAVARYAARSDLISYPTIRVDYTYQCRLFLFVNTTV